MPTSKQRREAARRHLERQLQRRQQRQAARKRLTLITSIVGTLVVVAVIAAFVLTVGHGGAKKAAASSASTTPSSSPSSTRSPLPRHTPAPVAARAPKSTSGPCHYAESSSTLSKNPSLFDVGLPPDPSPTATKVRTAVFHTNQGTITAQLTGASAPCNVQSLAYLIGKKFYDGTACPRSVNSGIYVVQCGDPSGSTSGGPTYTVKDENLSSASYPAGAIAMANSGPNTNGSQFFFITKDSTGALGKSYTVVGRVTSGLDVLQKVAAAGDDGSNQAGGGRPNLDLIFQSVTIS